MARLAESSVRELLNDADGYFYFVQRPSLRGRAPASSIPAKDFFFLFGSVAITRPSENRRQLHMKVLTFLWLDRCDGMVYRDRCSSKSKHFATDSLNDVGLWPH